MLHAAAIASTGKHTMGTPMGAHSTGHTAHYYKPSSPTSSTSSSTCLMGTPTGHANNYLPSPTCSLEERHQRHSLRVIVKNQTDGRATPLTLDVDAFSTVRQLKEAALANGILNPTDIALYHKGATLMDSHSLMSYGIKYDDAIQALPMSFLTGGW